MFRLLIVSAMLAQAAPPPAAPPAAARAAEDGAELPAYSDRMFTEKLPLAEDLIGALPEDVSTRVYSTERSKERAARANLPEPPCNWFAFQVNGANLAAFNLVDGRVSEIRFYFEKLSARRILQLQHEFGALNPDGDPKRWQTIEVAGTRLAITMEYATEQPGAMHLPINGAAIISIAIPPAELWMLSNPVSDQVKAAARQKNGCNGMPLELAHAIFGAPTSIAEGEGVTIHQWIMEEDSYSFIGGTFQYTGKIIRRILTMTFTNGVATFVQDQDF